MTYDSNFAEFNIGETLIKISLIFTWVNDSYLNLRGKSTDSLFNDRVVNYTIILVKAVLIVTRQTVHPFPDAKRNGDVSSWLSCGNKCGTPHGKRC